MKIRAISSLRTHIVDHPPNHIHISGSGSQPIIVAHGFAATGICGASFNFEDDFNVVLAAVKPTGTFLEAGDGRNNHKRNQASGLSADSGVGIREYVVAFAQRDPALRVLTHRCMKNGTCQMRAEGAR